MCTKLAVSASSFIIILRITGYILGRCDRYLAWDGTAAARRGKLGGWCLPPPERACPSWTHLCNLGQNLPPRSVVRGKTTNNMQDHSRPRSRSYQDRIIWYHNIWDVVNVFDVYEDLWIIIDYLLHDLQLQTELKIRGGYKGGDTYTGTVPTTTAVLYIYMMGYRRRSRQQQRGDHNYVLLLLLLYCCEHNERRWQRRRRRRRRAEKNNRQIEDRIEINILLEVRFVIVLGLCNVVQCSLLLYSLQQQQAVDLLCSLVEVSQTAVIILMYMRQTSSEIYSST